MVSFFVNQKSQIDSQKKKRSVDHPFIDYTDPS